MHCAGPGQAAQDRSGQSREVPDKAEQDRAGLIRVGQCRTGLGKTWHGQQNRTGSGRAVLGSTGPGRIG